MTRGLQEVFYEIHGNGILWTQWDWQLLEESVESMLLGFVARAGNTGAKEVFDCCLDIMKCWKVEGTLESLKGITSYLKDPY